MKIYKTAKINLPKKSSSNSCIAKKVPFSTYKGAEGEEKANEPYKTSNR